MMVLRAFLISLATMTMFVLTEAVGNQEVDVHLVRRGNGKDKQPTSPRHNPQSSMIHRIPSSSERLSSHAKIKDRFYHTLSSLQGETVRGVLHTEVRADPQSKHQFPSTTIQEGKKGGTVISAFMNHSKDRGSTFEGNKPLRIHIGSHSTVQGSKLVPNSPHVAGFVESQYDNAKDKLKESLATAKKHKFEYKASSSHTVADVSHSENVYPSVRVHPGRESGHIMSLFIRPASPQRDRSPETGTPNLIGRLDSTHQGQQSGRKRGRDDRSSSPTGRHGSPSHDLNLKLGLK